ncbi:MAG: hypothetical protein JSR46_05320 [Verrucomicrobia bacterium]|nr:hypothetical protein [Verrucomicrobiota bacterium]
MQVEASNNFTLMPIGPMIEIANFLVREEKDISQLSKLATVCSAWKIHLQDNQFWIKPFTLHINSITYPIDLSSATTCKTKLQLSKVTREQDFQTLIDNDNKRYGIALDKNSDFTDFFAKLIKEGNSERLALYLLYKPKFDESKIFYDLRSCGTVREFSFCISLLIKLHYNLSGILKHEVVGSRFIMMELLGTTLHSDIDIEIPDLLKCTIDFSSEEMDADTSNSSFSILYYFLICWLYPLYEQGFFKDTQSFVDPRPSLTLTDKRLLKYCNTGKASETKATQFLRDLVFNCKLNLDIKKEIIPGRGADFLPCKTYSVLSVLREMAKLPELPKNNAFKIVINEYDAKLVEGLGLDLSSKLTVAPKDPNKGTINPQSLQV